jgi:hypothetical protein
MATWIWIMIAVAIVVVCVLAAWWAASRRRTSHLKEQFGPEYARTAENTGGRREAEAELRAREKRREKLDIHPLGDSARDEYARRWQRVQQEFVDSPAGAVARADALVNAVMSEKGYPMEDFDTRAGDISVDHASVVDNYRAAHRIFLSLEDGTVSTEEERKAMQHYRSLFDDLLGRTRPVAPANGSQTREVAR